MSDFGLCHLFDSDEPGEERATAESEVVGSFFCTPPELDHGRLEAVDPSCDVYYLGKLLYRLLCGKRLPREMHREPLYDLTKQSDTADNAPIYELLDRTIVEDPKGRYADAQRLSDSVETMMRVVSARKHAIRLDAPQPCSYCVLGRYRVEVDPRWWFDHENDNDRRAKLGQAERALKKFDITRYGVPWLVLRCDSCGHIQIFRLVAPDNRREGAARAILRGDTFLVENGVNRGQMPPHA